MQVFFHKELNNKNLRVIFIFFLILSFILSLAYQVCAVDDINSNSPWLEVKANLSNNISKTNIHYVWVMLSKEGIIHVIELLPENNFYFKSTFEPGEYTIEDISVIADDNISFNANAPDRLTISNNQRKNATLLIEIEGRIAISSPVSTEPSPELLTEVEPKESTISDFIEKILELKPKSSSGIYTIVIFIILSLLILYLKFRKGNTNNE